MKRQHPESELQKACVKWFKLQYPKDMIWANANGGARSPIEAAIMKGEGVTAGIPDLTVIVNKHLFFVEMKAKTGRLTPQQAAIHERLKECGFDTIVCKSFIEFVGVVKCFAYLMK